MNLFPKSKFTGIVVILLIYAYYTHYNDNKKFQAEQVSDKSDIQHNESTIEDAPTKDLSIKDRVVNKIKENPTGKAVLTALVQKSFEDKYGKKTLQVVAAEESGAIAVIDILRGTGEKLNCGSTATIHYQAFLDNGLQFDSTKSEKKDTPLTIKFGGGQIIKGIEEGLIGMKEGGTRKLSIAPQLAFDDPDFTNNLVKKGEVVLYRVQLESIKDGPYKVSEDISVLKETKGSGNTISMCGDKVKIKYDLKTYQGSSKGEVGFTIGKGEVPIGLEFAARNMRIGGTKSVSIPASLLKTAGKSILKQPIQFSTGEFASATIERIE